MRPAVAAVCLASTACGSVFPARPGSEHLQLELNSDCKLDEFYSDSTAHFGFTALQIIGCKALPDSGGDAGQAPQIDCMNW